MQDDMRFDRYFYALLHIFYEAKRWQIKRYM